MLVFLALLSACDPTPAPASDAGGAGGSSDDGASADTGPSAWSLDSGAAGSGSIDAAEAQASVQALLDRARTFTAAPLIQGYRDARSMGFDPCPEEAITDTDEYGQTVYWDGLCETPDGVAFNGPMTDWRYENIDIIGGMDFVYQRQIAAPTGFTWSGEALQGQTDVYDREDTFHFNCSCTALQALGVDPDGRTAWLSLLDGAREWTRGEEEVLDPDLGIQLTLWGIAEPDGARRFQLSGKLSAFADGVGTGEFNLTVEQQPDGSCTVDGEQLQMVLRETRTGHWAEVTFPDGDPACDAVCGTLPDDQQLCLDATPLVAWEGVGPW